MGLLHLGVGSLLGHHLEKLAAHVAKLEKALDALLVLLELVQEAFLGGA